MRLVRLSQPRPDCFLIDEGRDWQRGLLVAGAALVWAGIAAMLPTESGVSVGFLLSGCGVLPVLAVSLMRLMRRRTVSVVRTPGRMMLDGEPLELARVELRVTHWPLIKSPTGYALSLWVMTASGPEDVALGHFTSMLEASRVGGHLEEFIARSSSRQPGRTPL